MSAPRPPSPKTPYEWARQVNLALTHLLGLYRALGLVKKDIRKIKNVN